MTKARIQLPPKLIPVFLGKADYRGAYGGRGSAKTRSFAKMTAVRGYQLSSAGEEGVIGCAREFMNSLDDSSMAEVKAAIRSEPWLDAHYDIGEKYIRTRNGRIEYKFFGLRHNIDSVKSKARIRLLWVDEGEPVSEPAWQKTLPTVREEDAEVWVTWNPEKDGSPTDLRFRKNPPPNSKIVEINYTDNPWFPDILRRLMEADRARDLETYTHVWLGGYKTNSDAQVLRGRCRSEAFTPQPGWNGPFFGADWGFSVDPTTLVKCWVDGRKLYIEAQAYGAQVEIDNTPALFDKVPGSRDHVIRADSARPETISYMQRHGYPRCVGAEKWPGSVEDGVEHLRSYEEIIIHPSCTDAIREALAWSWKVDRLTGDVLPVLVDKDDHTWDAARYALAPLIKRRRPAVTKELRI